MRYPNREIVDHLRECYPKGCRVQLDAMDDPQAPPIGTLGTVRGVDDMGSIMVRWDTGGGLSVVYGADRCHRIAATGSMRKERPPMFNSKLSSLIDDAVLDCLAFGRGTASISTKGTEIDVTAEWAENETDIEITIKENDIVRLTFTEAVPAVFR